MEPGARPKWLSASRLISIFLKKQLVEPAVCTELGKRRSDRAWEAMSPSKASRVESRVLSRLTTVARVRPTSKKMSLTTNGRSGIIELSDEAATRMK
jgi:hypothetical protein